MGRPGDDGRGNYIGSGRPVKAFKKSELLTKKHQNIWSFKNLLLSLYQAFRTTDDLTGKPFTTPKIIRRERLSSQADSRKRRYYFKAGPGDWPSSQNHFWQEEWTVHIHRSSCASAWYLWRATEWPGEGSVGKSGTTGTGADYQNHHR